MAKKLLYHEFRKIALFREDVILPVDTFFTDISVSEDGITFTTQYVVDKDEIENAFRNRFIINSYYEIYDAAKTLDFERMETTGDFTEAYEFFDKFDKDMKDIVIYAKSDYLRDWFNKIIANYKNFLNEGGYYDRVSLKNIKSLVDEIIGKEFDILSVVNIKNVAPNIINRLLSKSPDEIYRSGYLFRGVSDIDRLRILSGRDLVSTDPQSVISLSDHILHGELFKDTKFISLTSDPKIAALFGNVIVVKISSLRGNLLTPNDIISKSGKSTEVSRLVRKNNEYVLEPNRLYDAEIPSEFLMAVI